MTYRVDMTSGFPPGLRRITVRELSRHTARVLAMVGGGETVEVTRNGEPVAMISAPDPQEATIRRLIRDGILPPDFRERQAKLFQYLRENPPPPTPPGQRPLSEILIEMREEERF